MEKYNIKYQKILEILPDVIECAHEKLIFVGGTALTIFYLKHRLSIDLDFIPIKEDEIALCRNLKGCLSKMGYHTIAGAFKNQFVVQFEETSIKIEIFEPETKIKKYKEYDFVGARIKVASINDLLQMKIYAYEKRMEARDLFDIFCILKKLENKQKSYNQIKELIFKKGIPVHLNELKDMVLDLNQFEEFNKMISNAPS